MKLNIFAQVMAFVLTWALFVTALPSNAGGVPGISVRQETAGALLGINCRGSSQCNGVCHPNIGNIKYFVDQIPDDTEFVNKQQIACHECVRCSTCPDSDKKGICVFAQSLKNGEKVKASVVKNSINALMSHGCKKCGSDPIHPGNNVNDGQITINYVYDFCKTGICGTKGPFSSGDVAEPLEADVSAPSDIVSRAESVNTVNEDEDRSVSSAFSPREAAPDSATTLLGINCRGSGRCSATCHRNSHQLSSYVYDIADAAYYGNGQKIACVKCKNINGHLDDDGFCAFANNMKTDEEISGTQVKQLMSALLDHGCKICGSVPIHPGNNVNSGQLTVNYVQETCREGIC